MIGRVLATIAITAFWVTMMTLLVERNILPDWRAEREAARAPNYRYLESLAAKPRAEQMGIYWGKRRIGQTVTRMEKKGPEFIITNQTNLTLDNAIAQVLGLGAGESVKFKFRATVVESRLADFRLEVFLSGQPEPIAIVDGISVGEELKVTVRQAGQAEKLPPVKFDSRRVLSGLLAPTYAPEKLKIGETWTISTLDFITHKVSNATARVTGRERITVEESEADAFVIKVRSGILETTVWANAQGEVLKEKVYGLTFEREKPGPATESDRKP